MTLREAIKDGRLLARKEKASVWFQTGRDTYRPILLDDSDYLIDD